MTPAIFFQQKPGDCPICQMELVPVKPSAGGMRTLTIKPSVKKLMKVDDWNEVVIIAKGNHLVQKINGHTTVDVTDNQAAKAAKRCIINFKCGAVTTAPD